MSHKQSMDILLTSYLPPNNNILLPAARSTRMDNITMYSREKCHQFTHTHTHTHTRTHSLSPPLRTESNSILTVSPRQDISLSAPFVELTRASSRNITSSQSPTHTTHSMSPALKNGSISWRLVARRVNTGRMLDGTLTWRLY